MLGPGMHITADTPSRLAVLRNITEASDASGSTPGNHRASVDRVSAAVTQPAARVATAPIVKRAIIIGSVNVIESATLAYADHVARRIAPAAMALPTNTAKPAITPTARFATWRIYRGRSERVLQKSAACREVRSRGVAPAKRAISRVR